MNAYNAKERIVWLDLARIFAILGVIMIHVSAQNFYTCSVDSKRFVLFALLDSMSRFSVPVFIMISGALILDREKKKDTTTTNIIKSSLKRVKRIAITFCIWSVLYYIWSVKSSDVTVNMKTFGGSFIKGYYHMWFLFMIVGLYLLTPLFVEIIKDKKLTEYYLVISVILCVVLPSLQLIVGDYIAQKIEYVLSNCSVLAGSSFYYILGYYLRKFNDKNKHTNIILCLGFLGTAATAAFTVLYSQRINEQMTDFLGYCTLGVVLQSAAVFVFFRDKISKKKTSSKSIALITKMSKYTFGTYLVHIFILEALDYYFNFNTVMCNPALAVILVFLATTLISFIISALLNQIPLVKKYMV